MIGLGKGGQEEQVIAESRTQARMVIKLKEAVARLRRTRAPKSQPDGLIKKFFMIETVFLKLVARKRISRRSVR